MAEPVPGATGLDEFGADIVCGLLRSAGLECGFRPTAAADSAFEGIGGGRVEVIVHAHDADAAREVLASAELP
jgi:hypothetical protein